MLVTGLLDDVNDGGRIVVLSSTGHQITYGEGIQLDNLDGSRGYQRWQAYGQSKLANLLFAKHLAKRVDRLAVGSVHPGVIQTNLGRHMNPGLQAGFGMIGNLFSKSIPQGAATQCYVAAHPDTASARGEYYADCNPAKPSRHGRDAALAERLWDKSEEIVASL